MQRTIDITNEPDRLNPWIRKSIELFSKTAYLDKIQKIYPFEASEFTRLDERIRRDIERFHSSRNTNELIKLLRQQTKFPYEDPVWFILNNVEGCIKRNPSQIDRIARILYSLTTEEAIARLESPPKLNTQTGPMFRTWLVEQFKSLEPEVLEASKKGIFILGGSEEQGKRFVKDFLKQQLRKRPDLICKVNTQYIIGEAKWIGQPGGNQGKQVQEVLDFCAAQRGQVRRIGIIDGFPWATRSADGVIINNKEAVIVQEAPFDIMSALLLKDYLNSFI